MRGSPMIQRTLKQINEMIQVENDLTPFSDVLITGVSIDSRKVEKGNLFIPLKGEHSDGHQFVKNAIENGASASLWSKNIPNPPENIPIIIVDDTLTALQQLAKSYRKQLKTKIVGITGSNGKTTTKDMTASLLSLQYKVQKTEGNYNNHIGLPLTILNLKEDTEIAVLEMGMSAKGEIDFLTNIAKPHGAVITNIGDSHLQDLGSREGIASAKLEIINGLEENGFIIYHGDEPLLHESLMNEKGKWKIESFGKEESNHLYPTEVELSDEGSTFKTNASNISFHLPVLGFHNILNSLAAMLVARNFDIPFEKMNDGFASLQLTNMRMERVKGAKGETIINDAYNASPTSMKAAIELVSSMKGFTKKIVVLGDMLELGPKEKEFHQEIGKSIHHEKIDEVFTYGHLGSYIGEGARENFSKEHVHSFLDKEELITKLKERTDGNTLILVKGSRGMRLEEVVHSLQQ